MNSEKINIQIGPFTKQVMRLKAVYRNTWFLPDADAIAVWYEALQTFSEKQIKSAIDYWIKTSQEEPKPSDLIGAIERSGLDARGGIKTDPTEWPVVAVFTVKGHRLVYDCRVSKTTEVTGAKKRAIEYAMNSAKKEVKSLKEVNDKTVEVIEWVPYEEADLYAVYMSAEQYEDLWRPKDEYGRVKR